MTPIFSHRAVILVAVSYIEYYFLDKYGIILSICDITQDIVTLDSD